MKRWYKYVSALLSLTVTTVCFAQDAPKATGPEIGKWNLDLDLNLNLTQNAYNDAWAGTEEGSISWTALSLLSADRQISQKFNWDNNLRLAFGQTHSQKDDPANPGKKKWQKPRKSTDEVDFETIGRLTLGAFADPFISARLLTKFTNEKNGETNMFDPKNFSESAGLARAFIQKPNAKMICRLGFTLRQHSEKDLDSTNDGGVEFVTEYDRSMPERNLKFNSNLRVFKALFSSISDEAPNDDWKKMDLDWRNTLSITVYKAIAINFYLQLLYDRDHQSNDNIQLKETLGLGIAYKLM